MASLTRDSDGEGYSGSRVDLVITNDRIEPWDGDSSKLVGNMLLVGTLTTGTYSTRDWWKTNVITEIISETEDEIRFNTASGSTYTLKVVHLLP